MKLIWIFLLAVSCFGAIGDNAPPLPSTYCTAHPCFPRPSTAELNSIYTNRATSAAYYVTAANNFDTTRPGNGTNGGINAFRRLLVVAMAYNLNSDPGASTYINKIKAMANNAGGWQSSAQLYFVTDGVGGSNNPALPCTVGNACKITTTAGNFLTGCGGGTCAGSDLVVNSRTYTLSSVDGTGKIATITGNSTDSPIGSGLTVSVIPSGANGQGNFIPGLALPIMFDWTFTLLDATSKAEFIRELKGFNEQFEESYVTSGLGPSPYNDQYATRTAGGVLGLVVALAMLPADDASAIGHIRFQLDVWHNQVIPVWKQVWGSSLFGVACKAENDAGTATAGGVGPPRCRGAWHESLPDYFVQAPFSVTTGNFILPALLTLASVEGRMTPVGGIPEFFNTEGWVKNITYWSMYQVRPDFTWNPVSGGTSRRYFFPDYNNQAPSSIAGPGLGYHEGLAAIYNDNTLRGWGRVMANNGATPNGFEPSAWPWYTPDSSAKTVNFPARLNLSTSALFDGVGKLFMKTGWGEDDTEVTFSCPSLGYWSHENQESGTLTAFNRGTLLNISDIYRTGSQSEHHEQFGRRVIARNGFSFYDAADIYPDEPFLPIIKGNGAAVGTVLINDGGQRFVGSEAQVFTSPSVMQSPADVPQLMRSWEFYNQGGIVAYTTGSGNPPKYTYADCNDTKSYNNFFSQIAHSTPANSYTAGSLNRSFRVQHHSRKILFEPSKNGATGLLTAAYLFVLDHAIAAPGTTPTKKVIWHTINLPTVGATVSGVTPFTITRADLATSKPFVNLWPEQWGNIASPAGPQIVHCPGGVCGGAATQYQYAGKGLGWQVDLTAGVTMPAPAIVGGTNAEFLWTDSNGTLNHNEAMNGQLGTLYGSTAGGATGPFAITGGSNDKMYISVDGGVTQTVTLTAGGARTATQVVTDINAALTGGAASVEGIAQNQIGLRSNNNSPGTSSIAIVAGANSAYTTLGLTVGTYSGSSTDEGFCSIGPFMHPAGCAASSPNEAGAYRLEETTGATTQEEWFLNIFRFTSTADTVIVTAPTATTISAGTGDCPAGGVSCFEITISDNSSCTRKWTVPKKVAEPGVATATGAGCPYTF